MKKYRGFLLTLPVLFGIVLVYIAFYQYVSYKTASSLRKTLRAMTKSEFSCPNGRGVKVERWGEVGYSRYCGPRRNGKWEAWVDQYRCIEGEYKNEKKHGRWTWYRQDGSIQTAVTYEDNRELTDEKGPSGGNKGTTVNK